MTLVINATYGVYALQASDRLISLQSRLKNRYTEWDLHSNKSVVVVGYKCWLVIGYTGIAYLDGRPADQKIAECVSGIDDLGGMMVADWFFGPELHYREISNRIIAGVTAAFNRLPTNVRL